MYIASKMEVHIFLIINNFFKEIIAPKIKDFEKSADDGYSSNKIRDME